MDGTLTEPQPWMFLKMRSALGIAPDADILAHVAGIEAKPAQAAAMALVERIESEAMQQMRLGAGVADLVDYLRQRGVRRAVLTRNFMCVLFGGWLCVGMGEG